MNDYEIVNKCASKDGIALYGKYDKNRLCTSMGVNSSEIEALARLGLVDVETMIVSGVSNAYYTFYIFNDRWRELKNYGSIEALMTVELNREKKKNEKIELEYQLIKSQSDFQKLNNEFIAKQSELIDSQVKANNSVISTNDHVKDNNKTTRIILIISVAVTVINLLPATVSVIHDYRKDHTEDSLSITRLQVQSAKAQLTQRDSTIKSLEQILNKKTNDSTPHK